MNKRLLILGAGEMQVPVIRKANDMGLHTIVADMDANAPGMGYASEPVLVSTMDKEGVLESVLFLQSCFELHSSQRNTVLPHFENASPSLPGEHWHQNNAGPSKSLKL
mgnify:CR=1 FL=1